MMRLPRCTHCGDVIGVYEPLVMLADHHICETSIAARPDLPAHGEYYHRACHAQRQQDDTAVAEHRAI